MFLNALESSQICVQRAGDRKYFITLFYFTISISIITVAPFTGNPCWRAGHSSMCIYKWEMKASVLAATTGTNGGEQMGNKAGGTAGTPEGLTAASVPRRSVLNPHCHIATINMRLNL